MTAPARVKQDDVKRLVRGCLAGGMAVGTVRLLPDGSVEVYARDAPGSLTVDRGNPLDRLLDHGQAPS